MKELSMIAFDLGASSGRGIIGRFNGERLEIEELHRFSNDPVEIAGHLYWDVLRLYHEIQQGLLKYAKSGRGSISSVAIDTWGVDYGLLDNEGQLIGNPYHYRDVRTEGMFEAAFERMPREEIYNNTGVAFQKFNTLFQLLSVKLNNPWVLEKARTLLFMPDLLSYFLTGEKMTEFTEASTSQLLDAETGGWSKTLLDTMSIPGHIFTSIEYPGAVRGKIKKSIGDLLGIGEVPFIATATHDTGAAVAAVPALEGSYAFLSSGTWSLMGVEVPKPVINEKTLQWNYTNEGCVGGGYRLLRNIMGLWIIQECKRKWDRRGETHSFGDLVEMADRCTPFAALIDPDDDLFYNPGDMPRKVQQYCADTGQRVPQSKGEIVRCIYESLALKYRWSVERLEEIIGKRLDALHIVGGGTQNRLLNQFTSNALKRPVVCGPTEATAIGNIMIQAMALGEVKDQSEIRQVVKRSFPTEDYQPEQSDIWDDAYERFLKITEK